MGRPLTRLGFSAESYRPLVYWLARGSTVQQAALKAGIPQSARLSDALKTEQHAAMLRDAIDDALSTELAPLAIKTLERMLRDESAPAKVRLDAAKTVLDRSGHAVGDKAGGAADGRRDIAEMTQEELRAFIARGESLLAELATPVEAVEDGETEPDDVEDEETLPGAAEGG